MSNVFVKNRGAGCPNGSPGPVHDVSGLLIWPYARHSWAREHLVIAPIERMYLHMLVELGMWPWRPNLTNRRIRCVM